MASRSVDEDGFTIATRILADNTYFCYQCIRMGRLNKIENEVGIRSKIW